MYEKAGKKSNEKVCIKDSETCLDKVNKKAKMKNIIHFD